MISTSLLSASLLAQAPKPLTYVLTWRGDHLKAKMYAESSPGMQDVFNIRFDFTREVKGKEVVVAKFDCGESSGMPVALVCDDFLENGRSQIYIATTHGEWNTRVLDFDGKKVLQVYSNLGGRTHTWLSFDRKKGYFVTEFYDEKYKTIYLRGLGKAKK